MASPPPPPLPLTPGTRYDQPARYLLGVAGERRFGDSHWFRDLPVASAVVLVAIGLWFLHDGWQVLSAR